MLKKTFFVATILFIVSCTKDDVFDRNNQIIINPIAKCENGFAGQYPCNDYDLLTYFSLDEIGGTNTTGGDCWGWVDPVSKKEYALMCTNKGVTFIDITNPEKAIILGTLKSRSENNPWRDVKIFQSVAFIVSEAPDHGMQIFNLRNLRDIQNPPIEFTSDRDYTIFGNARNIVINEDSGFAYVIGSNTFSGGPHFIDINSPFRPKGAGGYKENAYSNDAQVISYLGPDTDYIDKEILIGSNKNEVVILDVTDKENPITISTITYPNIGQTNKGSFTKDFKYFILGDELDEINNGLNTRSIIFDFTDLDNPVHYFDYEGATAAVDHNGYINGHLFYQANYTNGVRVLDLSNIENKTLIEVGYFDTYPDNNNTSRNGVSNVYPFLPSGNIIISDINNGLFVIRKSKS